MSSKRLDAIVSEVLICITCPLSETRRNAVPGEGNAKAEIMLIGEAPGRSEDLQGRPFVGSAGNFLEALLGEIGLSRADLFICNILKCRPPNNRPPKPLEVQTCTPYLDRQIKTVKPKLIVSLGSHSTAYIFSKFGLQFTNITEVHGKFFEAVVYGKRVKIFPSYHPAAALYNPQYKKQIIEDFKKLKQETKIK
ncbi:uracil-DNA glycosylase [Candidatus Bathyarchaeota archaeon]|nr:uracil-DNA glycosylase [Candidatus Bathyarchaeota archaeon]